MAGRIHLEVITPEHMMYQGEASIVQLPGSEGEMGILPSHAPLVTMLSAGVLMYRNDQGEYLMAVGEGFATVAENQVVCLVDSALSADQVKPELVAQRKQEVEAELVREGGQSPRLRRELGWLQAQQKLLRPRT